MSLCGEELNARQRRHVHMHSSIFDSSASTPDLYKPAQEREVFRHIEGSLRENNRGAPDVVMPSPADCRCTQNADQGAVIPGSHGQKELIQQQEHGGAMRTPRMPRTSGAEFLVHDGQAKQVIHASSRDTKAHEAIPKEFWATSVNLQWHDTRHEQCRDRDSGRQGLTAQQNKRQELSSEIFGKSRITAASTSKLAARQELLPDSADHLKLDSTLQRSSGLIPKSQAPGEAQPQEDAKERLYHNLADSARNPMCSGSPVQRHQPIPEEDPANINRRRSEKNFSDMFGATMGERKVVRGNREEVVGSNNCSFLDSRGEIATRNKEHWRPDVESAGGRKQQETSSHLFGYTRPSRPELQPDAERVLRSEGACWEASGIMQTTSEIARRRRMKDHLGDFEDKEGATHAMRKQGELGSTQVRRNMGYPQAPSQGTSARDAPASSPHRCTPPWATDASAQDRKLASLQSSIFT